MRNPFAVFGVGVVAILALAAAVNAIIAIPVMIVWNMIAPAIGLGPCAYWQALAVTFLLSLLFGKGLRISINKD